MKKIFLIFLSLFVFYNYSSAKTFTAIIWKVSDGDTVWVKKGNKKIKLRLIGIDTPEKFSGYKLTRDAKKCAVHERQMSYLGKLASKFAKSILKKRVRVTIVTYGKGYFKRTLAKIILPDHTDFNKLMIQEGYACLYKKTDKLSYNEFNAYYNSLLNAKKLRKGLWKMFPNIMNCLCFK